MRFYFNGVADANQPAVNLRFGIAFEPLVIGADFPGGDEFFAGTIRDVRVYGRALTAAELFATQNFPPVFMPVPSTNIVAGQNLFLPVTASDPNQGQTLQYQLVSGPSGASVNSLIGTFAWRPTLGQSPSTNIVTMSVTDNGSPSLSSTQSFTVTVRRPVSPILGDPFLSGTNLTFKVTGDLGPDYVLSASTNLIEWIVLQTTNPPTVPFVLTVPVASDVPRRFYRVEHR